MAFSTSLDRPDRGLDRPGCLETLYPQGLDNFTALTTENVYMENEKLFPAHPLKSVSRARHFCLSRLSNLSRPNNDRPFVKSKPVKAAVNPVKATPC